LTTERPVSTAPVNLFEDGIAASLAQLRGQEQPETPTEEPAEPSDSPEYEPEEEEPEAEATAEVEEEPEETEPAPKAQRHSTAEWAQILIKEGEQRLSEIPPRLHAEVFSEYKRELTKQVSAQTQQVIAGQLRQEQALREYVANVDEHFATDPDGKLAWMENDPNARNYLEGKRYLAQVASRAPEEHVAAISALQQRSERQYARLTGFPDQQAELATRAQQGRYPSTEEGMAQLEQDVDTYLAEAARGNVGRTQQNGTGTPTRTARRPLVTGGSGPKPASATPDISKIKDPYELMTMGVEQQSRRLRATR